MSAIKCTLVADGSSDVALLPILDWVVQRHIPVPAEKCVWADLRRVPARCCNGLARRLRVAADLYPCDLMFVHRDAESQPAERRYEEVRLAVGGTRDGPLFPHVSVVPVRMQETWLLIEEGALRSAVGNPHGTAVLDLPDPSRLERVADPKAVLYRLLKTASGFHGRRLKSFRPDVCARQVSEHLRHIGSLGALAAFRRLEGDVRAIAPQIVRV